MTTNKERRLATIETRFLSTFRARNGYGRIPQHALSPQVQPPSAAGDWPAWLLGLARQYQLIQHSFIDGRIELCPDAYQHSDAEFLAGIVERLNAQARKHKVLLLLVARDEIYQVIGWLDSNLFDLDIHTGSAGGVIGVDLTIAPPYDRLTREQKRLSSDVSLAMVAFCKLSAWPFPRDLRDAREALVAMLAYAVPSA